MAVKLYFPQFNKFKPVKLERLASLVSSDYLNSLSFDEAKVNRAIDKLRRGIELRNNEVKVLCYHLKNLQQENLFDKFNHNAIRCFNRNNRIFYHIKGLLNCYYDEYDNFKFFNLLKFALDKNKVWKDPIIPIRNLLSNVSSPRSFKNHVCEMFANCHTFEEINTEKEVLLINNNHNIFIYILLDLLDQKVTYIRSYDELKLIKEIANFLHNTNLLKPAFEKFLLSQRDRRYFDDLPGYLDAMFNLIGDTLGGDPYGRNRTKWMGINEEATDVFRLWKTQKNIGTFFGEIAGDPVRLEFWKKYSHYFYRVEYFEQYKGAILMETDRHLFVEFAVMGAMYMYDKKILSIRDIEYNPDAYSRNYMVSNVLKNRISCEERLEHRPTLIWPENFKLHFEFYGYKMQR